MDNTIQNLITRNDPENLFSVLVDSHRHVLNAWQKEIPYFDAEGVQGIVFCGMGGSAISGNLAINFLRDELRIPFYINRSYSIPRWAGENTLVIASSYSGNTEETISAFKEAHEKNCRTVCIANGGELGALASKWEAPLFGLEEGLPPRYALYSSFFTLLKILESCKFIPPQVSFVNNCASLLQERADVYCKGGFALDMAGKLSGSVVAVYSAERVNDAVGMRLKTQLNENSKSLAFHASMSEVNHNEIVGWEGLKECGGTFSVVMLTDPGLHPGLCAQFDAARGVIEKEGIPVFQVQSDKTDHKTRLVDMMYLSDWISYYLALIGGKNPATIDNIYRIKEYIRAHRGK